MAGSVILPRFIILPSTSLSFNIFEPDEIFYYPIVPYICLLPVNSLNILSDHPGIHSQVQRPWSQPWTLRHHCRQPHSAKDQARSVPAQVLENCQQKIVHLAMMSSRNEGSKDISGQKKPREFVITRTALQEHMC